MANRARFGLLLYCLLASIPLFVTLTGELPPSRHFPVELSVALGFLGLAIMGLQFFLTARFRSISALIGTDSMLQFHREMGLIALAFILAHPLILVAHDPAYLSFLDPRVNLPRAFALNLSIAALLAVTLLPFYRARLGINYQWWRLSHGVLAALLLLIGLAHIYMVGYYTSSFLKQLTWLVVAGIPLVLFGYGRIVKPLQSLRRPWKVGKVKKEAAGVWTISLVPVAHGGISFLPGQYVWLVLGATSLSLEQHPFTISSSAEKKPGIDITIKSLGDFTSTIENIAVGTSAYVEGPYGKFTCDIYKSEPLVFIAGGIGITPAISSLRTLADRSDGRRLTLIYANRDIDSIVFSEDLRNLGNRLNLEVFHILDVPSDNPEYLKGPLSRELLLCCLPEGRENFRYFLCGPELMMNKVESELLTMNIAREHIHSERFNIA